MNMTLYHYVSRTDQDQFLDHEMMQKKNNEVKSEFYQDFFMMYFMEWIFCVLLVIGINTKRDSPDNLIEQS